jgi:Amiloride-sensitive sodium channel
VISSRFSTSLTEKCLGECRQSCAPRSEVQATISTGRFPAKAVRDPLKQFVDILSQSFPEEFQITKEELADLIQVDIFFSSFGKLAVETEEKTPVIQFIGNVGGHLGERGGGTTECNQPSGPPAATASHS